MSDTNHSSPRQIESEAHQHHTYDNPRLSGKEFLLAVMHDPTVDIHDRIKAASTLLRLFPYDWDPPAFTYRIGGIPDCSLSTSSDPGATDERLGNSSHSSAIAHKGSSRMTDDPPPLNIETIISDIKSGNYPQPTLCTICGHYMPYPCSTSKTPIN
jgi:hypothetical protein